MFPQSDAEHELGPHSDLLQTRVESVVNESSAR